MKNLTSLYNLYIVIAVINSKNLACDITRTQSRAKKNL